MTDEQIVEMVLRHEGVWDNNPADAAVLFSELLDGFLWSHPAIPDKRVQFRVPNTHERCVLSQRQGAPINNHSYRRALITGLLLRCRPSAVCGFVVAVNVNAVQRATWWAASHIFKERRVAVAPLATHLNTAHTVLGVPLVGLTITPPFRVGPSSVLPRRPIADSVSVLQASLSHNVYRPTTTTETSATSQVVRQDRHLSTARATTEPSCSTSVIGDTTDHCQSTKRLTRQVQFAHPATIPYTVSPTKEYRP